MPECHLRLYADLQHRGGRGLDFDGRLLRVDPLQKQERPKRPTQITGGALQLVPFPLRALQTRVLLLYVALVIHYFQFKLKHQNFG